jgi:hypothetical protein
VDATILVCTINVLYDMAMCSGMILTATARWRRQIDGLAWAASADRRLGVDGSGTVLTVWCGQCLQIGRRMAAASTAADRRLQLGVCSSVARRWQPAWRQSGSPAAT